MTKDELRTQLQAGKTLDDLFTFRPGQECLIFKEHLFPENQKTHDEIIYIPDLFLNELHPDTPCANEEEIEETLKCCYTANDFLEEVKGSLQQAEMLFYFVDWQHPSSAIGEGGLFDDEEAI